MKAKLDALDGEILTLLQGDGRMSNVDLSRKIGISPPATLERVKKLEQAGVINGYAALTNPQSLGLSCTSFVEVTLGRHGRAGVERFIADVTAMSEVLECHHITGDADFLLKVVSRDIPAYEDFVLRKLTALADVQHLKTLVVLSTLKQETRLPIPIESKDKE
ncbi:Lrp/AsnC family transcriptional regulator [Puniceicoccales bacterium CK1056]|uniref:Lrp/AsnC family transcriptional regulator n=1 Tax=Oceanipulchritudo coccoides TaxID=2706888 RepID=A0A6B2M6H3_9BACT|nr:Lrp/AsnC family transcriptional regulator [Oceanipulchritudo coccoides]NDV63405.1 Lrp/AsnC family transcriptional regulator [Oceanipulchritudo coccoides]